MTRVGIVGLGFMGMVHHLSYEKLEGATVIAMADNDKKKLSGDWTSIQGNFGPPGEQMDLRKVATYESADDLIANPDVDLVDITLPPSMHADVAIRALQAGKHVFCEKPMAMTVEDCERMVAAASGSEGQLFIGHVLPFFPEYAWALREILSGDHGQVIGATLKRVISDPAWLAHYWSAEKIGGPMLDLHVHDAHFVRYAFGMPHRVTTRGSLRDNVPEHWNSLLEFADSPLVVHVSSGVVNQSGRPFTHGFEIRLERATLMFDFAIIGDKVGYLCEPTILLDDGSVRTVDLGDGDPMLAFEAELRHCLNVLTNYAEAGALACDLARDAIRICRMQSDSLMQA